jgi:hypothetical protein
MPNWCSNEVVITANDPAVIEKIMSIAPGEDSEFSMENFVPTPNELLEGTGWYEWRIKEWGTKWDMSELYMSTSERSISLGYSTAWSPNIAFWESFSKFYPVKISHQYLEEGMCFIGEASIEDGRVEDYTTEITSSLYERAGATLDADGNIDWDKDQDYNLFDVFPLGTSGATLTRSV